tara:strand:+ start:5670 stop:7775 length:2106 start_codon:yes stop_codon:yes gene_type:complete
MAWYDNDVFKFADNKKPRGKGRPAIGVSGNTGYYGTTLDEYLRKLQGSSGLAIYDRMRRSDPQVGSILRAITLPIRQAIYYVEPASDDPKDIEIAENTETDFLHDMSMTWDDTIRHACLMFPFGFSILEKVWQYSDDKGRIVPRKLDPRLPQSIVEWKYDRSKRRLTHVVQADSDATRIDLPIEKLLVFTTEKEGDNWEGIPILRNSYKPWVIKDDLERINAIKHDRHGVGIPVMHVPANCVDGTPEFDDTVAVLESIYAHEQSYVVEPEGYEFRVEGADNAGTDILPDLRYYDEMIARSAMAMFLNLGTTQTGSRALGASFLEAFLTSVQAFADYITEIVTRFAIREYVGVNYATNEFPTMKVRRIQKIDPKVLAELANAGLINADDNLEDAIRVDMYLPEKQEDDGEQESPAPDSEPVQKPTDEDTDPEDEIEENAEYHHTHGMRFISREANDTEKLCNPELIEIRLNTDQANLTADLAELRNKQAEYIIRAVVGGRSAHNINVPFKGSMHSALMKEYKAQFKTGEVEIREEMQRQVNRKLSFADELPELKKILEIIEEEFDIKVQGAADKLKTIIATESLDLRKKGLTGDELLASLIPAVKKKVTDAPLKELSGQAVNEGWGNGRQNGMEAFADEIDYVYRSAILDGNLCDVCGPKDGVTHAIGDPEFVAPDPECEGGPSRCRCINIAVMKAESEPEQ